MSKWSLEQDLDAVFDACGSIWPSLHGAKLFITGGTGFIGCWLLESLRHADQRHGLDAQVTVLTRNPQAFKDKAPHLANYPMFDFIAGDVCSFITPAGEYTHLIHAATDASADLNENDPRRMFDTVIQGTRRSLDFAVEKSVDRVLFLSSGAVYGQQPWEMERVAEEWNGSLCCTEPRSAYAEGKRAAEMLCSIYAKQFGARIAIARIFALLGPYLSLDIHFAAGNFIRDAMQGKPVIVNSSGLACRSYLYASDLVVWLLHMLVRAESGKPYNVGSDESVALKDLAQRVASTLGNGEYEVRGAVDTGWNPGRYVPDTSQIGRDLGLHRTVSLDDAILRTALWHGWNGK
ncbi:NAD-dependent epimerase/dehydratase family protein [Candidatus Methylospira mobilis]|uniref:NAD-dependent epimerase/dehydratase family protein n=1 Tax=Candidatus Methylospira mobilis TaxID=1808979 RepID=A0A5Q0BGW7_9GAMM|nr:NAD-dependent epimerase/dehydratase family protein [Candidatus Methylospira mobilis]QFY41368.1 NAD-dependent epimerase/dehydratase family protein [Candidatus Methylospira mobilis]